MNFGLAPRVRLNLRTKGLINHQIDIQDLKFIKGSKHIQSGPRGPKESVQTPNNISFSRSTSRYNRTHTLEEALAKYSSWNEKQNAGYTRQNTIDSSRKRPTLNRTDSFKSKEGAPSTLAATGISTFYTKGAQKFTRNGFKDTSTTLPSNTKPYFYAKWKENLPQKVNETSKSSKINEKTSSSSLKRSRLNNSITSKKSSRYEKSVKAIKMAKKVFTPDEMKRLGYLSNEKTRSQFVKNCHGRHH